MAIMTAKVNYYDYRVDVRIRRKNHLINEKLGTFDKGCFEENLR